MKNLTLNLAAVTMYNAIMRSRDSRLSFDRYAIVGAVAELLGVIDENDEDSVQMAAAMRGINGLIKAGVCHPHDVNLLTTKTCDELDSFIRCYLLSSENSLRDSLIIMSLFTVYTVAVNNNSTVLYVELRDNIAAVVKRYESDLFYNEGRLSRTMVETISVMNCGNDYEPYTEAVLTSASNFAYSKPYKVAR